MEIVTADQAAKHRCPPLPTKADYATMIGVIERLAQIVASHRTRRHLSYRDAAEESGLAASWLNRLEHHSVNPGLAQVLTLLRWLEAQ